MGQTLTHGVYLPDEGERNCYSGLAANWSILDGAVGTIAEHSTQIAGKAPLVHTHSKADITDLFNSNFIPSANNSYDLGSSSNQWNNLYAKNYYYNGVAWGLDKANTWSQNNRIQAFLEMQYLASGGYSDIRWYDENNANCCTFRQSANFLTIGKKYTSKSSWYDGAQILITASGAVIFKGYDGANTQSAAFTYDSFYPEQNNAINLGTSTNKWKTINGINPGALSLPSGDSDNIDTKNWDFSWNANYVTAPFDGYISIACFGSVLQINNETKSYAMTFAPGADGYICGLLPVSAGDSIKVLVNRTQTSIYEGYKFIKSRGNV